MSHFGYIGHHLIVAIIDHIPNGIQWLGDVQWGHLMTHEQCGQIEKSFSSEMGLVIGLCCMVTVLWLAFNF